VSDFDNDLWIPVYLNQQIVFDLLAVLDDGLSQVTQISSSRSSATSDESQIGAEVGASNVFAFLGVKFGGTKKGTDTAQERTQESVQKVHTPASLFSRLRRSLKEKGIVRSVPSAADSTKVGPGDFVEFEAQLAKSPLLETMERMRDAMKMAVAFGGGEETGGQPAKRRAKNSRDEIEQLASQIEAMPHDLTSNSVEVVGTVVGSEWEVVLPALARYFAPDTGADSLGGIYRVFGKVMEVRGKDAAEGIDLLKSTPLGILGKSKLDELLTTLGSLGDQGMDVPEQKSTVGPPALRVLPVGIYV
jgi:hypothetical protein